MAEYLNLSMTYTLDCLILLSHFIALNIKLFTNIANKFRLKFCHKTQILTNQKLKTTKRLDILIFLN